jgi:ATP-dependent Lhr-like helicase
MRAGLIEPLHTLTNPLDVLAQQVIATLAVADWTADNLLGMMRRAHPYATLGEATWKAVLDMLAGRYPSEDFAGLRARIVWDRETGVLSARPGALRLAVISGGTIPDRGLFGVFLAGDDATSGAKRVGELDEEMVYESRVGDTFTLGSSTWRIEAITPDRVLVSPAPGLPGRLPFWKGDSPARPVPLGEAMGQFVRTLDQQLTVDADAARKSLADAGLDCWAADNLCAYLAAQRQATGRLPDDRTVVVEKFRDELGDWRLAIHSPLGARIHAPWALVIAARLRERLGVDVAATHSDDGIMLRLPDGDTGWEGGADGQAPPITADDLLIDADDVSRAVREQLGLSVMFAARFREAAARALLLPRARPDKRQPLWQQRQRAAQLLSVASQFPDFPIMLEAARECLQDEFDCDALARLMRDLDAGRVRLVDVTTASPSPFAQSLLFGYTAQFMYDDDAPLAERRAAALSLDPDLLAELLGDQGALPLADLLDASAVEQVEADLQCLTPGRQAKDAESLWDLLSRTGPHPLDALRARCVNDSGAGSAPIEQWLSDLEATKRIVRVQVAGVDQWAVIGDAGRLRDGLGVTLPRDLPAAYLDSFLDPLGDLICRHLRTHGPVAATAIASRFALPLAAVTEVLSRLEGQSKAVRGALRPSALGGTGDEWCDPDVLRMLRRRSLAALRAQVEAVEPASLGVFLPRWQHVGAPGGSQARGRARAAGLDRSQGGSQSGLQDGWHSGGGLRGVDGLLRAIEQLAGAPVPASALESLVLPTRVADYRPEMLDELTASGEVLWCGHSRLPGSGGGDGLISLHLADDAPLTLPQPLASQWSAAKGEKEATDAAPSTHLAHPGMHRRILDILADSGGFFLPHLADLAGATQAATLEALLDLVWAGSVSNDSLAALREAVGSGLGGSHRAPRAPARVRPLRPGRSARFSGLMRPAASGIAASAVTLRAGSGRWSALPAIETDPTIRAHAAAQVLLDRHGILTRGVALSEVMAESFRDIYPVLRAQEDNGTIRRGYFIEGLGGSQFALPGAVDALRAATTDLREKTGISTSASSIVSSAAAPGPTAVLLAAMDPANPYGAALPWPGEGEHRPGRKAGAVVVLVDGSLAMFVERGGKTVLTFTDQAAVLAAAADTLTTNVRDGRLGKVLIHRIDGVPALTAAREENPAARALLDAGFSLTPSGLRTR